MPSLYDLDRGALARLLPDQPSYRVDQIWQGLYEKAVPVDGLTNVPKAVRARLAEAAPGALTPVTESVSRDGETVKWLWELDGGARVETVLMHYDDRVHRVRQHPGRLRHGLRVLRHRSGRVRAPALGRRDRRAGRRGAPRGGATSPAGCRTSCSWAWASRWPTTTTPGPRSSACTATSASRPATSRSRRSASSPASAAWPVRPCRSTSPCRCTPPTTRSATSSSRSTSATRSPPWPRPASDYLRAKNRRLSFEWALIDGVNDRGRDADPARRLRPAPAGPRQPHPAQPDARLPRHRIEARSRVRAFRDLLRSLGVNATVRQNRGTDIDAACGQLRADHEARSVTITTRR